MGGGSPRWDQESEEVAGPCGEEAEGGCPFLAGVGPYPVSQVFRSCAPLHVVAWEEGVAMVHLYHPDQESDGALEKVNGVFLGISCDQESDHGDDQDYVNVDGDLAISCGPLASEIVDDPVSLPAYYGAQESGDDDVLVSVCDDPMTVKICVVPLSEI